jgi:hypothetical protein
MDGDKMEYFALTTKMKFKRKVIHTLTLFKLEGINKC